MKVAVIGTSSGAGKTVLARTLAGLLEVPHVEFDALYHGPGWEPAADFEERVRAATAGPGWVTDGNYWGRLGDSVLTRADLVVWLDLPLRQCLRRLLVRTARRRGEILWNGNRETFRSVLFGRESLLLYTIRTHRRRRRELPGRLSNLDFVRLRSQSEIDAWLRETARGEGWSRTRVADP